MTLPEKTTSTLTDRVAAVLYEQGTGEQFDTASRAARVFYGLKAVRVLAALGLDDLDAAVERGAAALFEMLPGGRRWDGLHPSMKLDRAIRHNWRSQAEAALNAALTPNPKEEPTSKSTPSGSKDLDKEEPGG